jgi:hypothetical protein
MSMSAELEAKILRYYHVEEWRELDAAHLSLSEGGFRPLADFASFLLAKLALTGY